MKNKLRKIAIFATTLAMISAPKTLYANIIHHSTEVLYSSSIFQRDNVDNDTDESFNMYRAAFGENYESIQRNSRAVNRSTYDDGIHMNVLSTGVLTTAIGQEAYVFFTLQDETGDRLSNDMWLNTIHDWNTESGWARQLHFDEETNTATFVLEIWYFDNENFDNDYRDITLEINGLQENNSWNRWDNDDNVTIEVSKLLNGHNPTFITDVNEDVQSWRTRELELTGWSDGEIGRVDYVLENYLLTKDELSIPIDGVEGAYISNIAFIDNILHVQTKENSAIRDFNSNEWFVLDLLNDTGNWASTAYTFTVSDFDVNSNRIEGTQYTQRGYYIENVEDISSYYFEILSSTNNSNSVDLKLSFVSPVISGGISLEESKTIVLDGEELNINNIIITPMLLSFDFDVHTEDFNEFMDLFIKIVNNLEVELIFEDGTQERMPISWDKTDFFMMKNENEEEDNNIHRLNIVNNFDMNEIVAININGTYFEV